ncbi:hypothetical protein LTR10_000822 [Elasticomyces elasticus]|nr:hypothetical protein LTR10_000822 [Elasticomyces elasticus]KAK4979932.1 hypothetical protein LTR42_000239 [Elasticomyces elasticus]
MADRLVQEYLDRAHAAEQLVLELRVEANRRDWELDEVTVRLVRVKDRCIKFDFERLVAVEEPAVAKAKIAKLENTVRELKDEAPQESTTETAASLGSVSYAPVNTGNRVAPLNSYSPIIARSVHHSRRSPEPRPASITMPGKIGWREREAMALKPKTEEMRKDSMLVSLASGV